MHTSSYFSIRLHEAGILLHHTDSPLAVQSHQLRGHMPRIMADKLVFHRADGPGDHLYTQMFTRPLIANTEMLPSRA